MFPPQSTRQWILAHPPTDTPILSGPAATFKLETLDLPPLKDEQVLLKTLYLSNDPAQRGWIAKNADPARLYVPPVAQGSCMHARGIGEIIDSKSPNLPTGTLVTARTDWSEYAVISAKSCTPIQELPGIALTHYLGALGLNGLTAYYGLTDIARTSADDTVVISGAAGATGSMAVQIAKKLLGCKRVIGIAGTDDKCKWVVNSLGADLCLNYKSPSFKSDLTHATKDFVQVYFDNVGGEILDLMLCRMAREGRIAACGAISNYNKSSGGLSDAAGGKAGGGGGGVGGGGEGGEGEGSSGKESGVGGKGLKSYSQIITMRLQLKGFIVLDFPREKAARAVQEFIAAIKQQKITVDDQNETVVRATFEDIPSTWMRLFEAGNGNRGKLITQLT